MYKKSFLQIIVLALIFMSCKQSIGTKFDFFEYSGHDAAFDAKHDANAQYLNPILSGFYPDPSICRKGDTFYMVHSSFSFFPGIPIFKSTDLVNWEQIGHVLDRPSQLNLDGLQISHGIFAPAIEYNKFNDTFYLITTNVYGIGNFIVKTNDPEKGWSDPIVLPHVGGIDPSLFFDDDGKAYIVNNDAPIGTPKYEGHRAIWIHAFDTETDKTFGEPKLIVDGGIDISKKPVWIEGPHVYKRNGKYLLICAEGGTSVNHSQVALHADNVWGPYMPAPINPILTQRDLLEDRPNKITSVGHADIVEDVDGQTWAVFLGCRPYEGNYYNTGRETFLLPVQWADDTPVILAAGQAVPIVGHKANVRNNNHFSNGNFVWRDEFDSDQLDMRWLMIRTPRNKWHNIQNSALHLVPQPNNLYAGGQPAFVGHRQQHSNFEVLTKLNFQTTVEQQAAGLACFQNEQYNTLFAKILIDGQYYFVVDRTEGDTKRIAQVAIAQSNSTKAVYLKIVGKAGSISFYASFDNKKWTTVAENVDAKNLSTQAAGGFVGNIIGLYTGNNH